MPTFTFYNLQKQPFNFADIKILRTVDLTLWNYIKKYGNNIFHHLLTAETYIKVACTSGQFFEKIIKRYPIFSLQRNNNQIDQRHKLNILSVKFYFNSFTKGNFVFSPYGIMLSFTRFNSKNDMGTSVSRFYFWTRSIWGFMKMCSKFILNSLPENTSILDQRYKPP